MGGVSPARAKLSDELALVCDLQLSVRDLLLSLRQTFLKGRLAVHSTASAWAGDQPLMMRRRHLVLLDCERKRALLVIGIDEADERSR
jgi:hypothetical protein